MRLITQNLWLLMGLISGGVLQACSNGTAGTLFSDTPIAGITISAPSVINHLGYAVISNSNQQPANNLHYQIQMIAGSGNLITLPTKQCQSIQSNSDCILKINGVNANLLSGSFALMAINADGKVLDNKIIGVQGGDFSSGTTLPGVDGILLFYHKQLPAASKYLLINGFNSSDAAFNSAYLVDAISNEKLPDQKVLSANLAAGATQLTNTDSFTLSIPVTEIGNTYREMSLVIDTLDKKSSSTAKKERSLTIYPVRTQVNSALVEMTPEVINLTKNNPKQVVTIYNYGNKLAHLNKLSIAAKNITITDFKEIDLAPNSYQVVNLELESSTKHQPQIAGLKLEYSDTTAAQTALSDNIYVTTDYTHKAPSTQTGGLAFTSDNHFFTSEPGLSIPKVVSILNNGQLDLTGVEFTLPDNFKITNTDLDNSCEVQGNKVVTQLAPSHSCNVKISYQNNNITAESSTNIDLKFKYGETIQSGTLPANYEITVASPILVLPEQIEFADILDNNSTTTMKVIKLTNFGAANIKNLSYSIDSGSFNINEPTESSCGDNLPAHGSCNLAVEFGPAATLGEKNAQLIVLANGKEAATTQLSGIVKPESAQIVTTIAVHSGFRHDVGNGEESNPYVIKENQGPASIAITYANVSNQPIANFKIELESSNNWSLTEDNCANNIPSNEKCTAIYQFTGTTVMKYSPAIIHAYWGTKATNKTKIWAQIYATPHISVQFEGIESNSLWPATHTLNNINPYKIKFSLHGGYQETGIQPGVNAMSATGISYPNGLKCVLSSLSSNCQVGVLVGESTSEGNYTLNISEPAGVKLESSLFNFTVFRPIIFYTESDQRPPNWAYWKYNGQFPKDYESSDTAAMRSDDAICNQYILNQKFAAQFPTTKYAQYRTQDFKALLYKNNATIPGTTYFRADGVTKIATATGGWLVGLNGNLDHSILDKPTKLMASDNYNKFYWDYCPATVAGGYESYTNYGICDWSSDPKIDSESTFYTTYRMYNGYAPTEALGDPLSDVYPGGGTYTTSLYCNNGEFSGEKDQIRPSTIIVGVGYATEARNWWALVPNFRPNFDNLFPHSTVISSDGTDSFESAPPSKKAVSWYFNYCANYSTDTDGTIFEYTGIDPEYDFAGWGCVSQ